MSLPEIGEKRVPRDEAHLVDVRAASAMANDFKRDGYVVFPQALPADLLARTLLQYRALLSGKVERFGLRPVSDEREQHRRNDAVLNDFRPEGGNHDLNRWNMHLPSSLPFFDPLIVTNPAVIALLDSVFESDWLIYLVASDTPYPGSGFQTIHQDFSTFSVAINIALLDFDETNGAIEVWPGTHRPDIGGPAEGFSQAAYHIDPRRMAEIRDHTASKRLLLKGGSILVRDHRLVHRGTPNRSAAPRPMLSIYCARPHEVPYRWLADACARVALGLRRHGRGAGATIQRRALFDLGNILGRTVEEASLSDRDYRRPIPADVWDSFPPRTRSLFRFASVERGIAVRRKSQGSLRGCLQLAGAVCRDAGDFLSARMLGRPRNP